mmetsp:Transcript_74934/g.160463  ORF Transcript_74934/g.160463 Transcript_74934/m.160463 type:complete len:114 (-) Transcript_74934:36-377(-)
MALAWEQSRRRARSGASAAFALAVALAFALQLLPHPSADTLLAGAAMVGLAVVCVALDRLCQCYEGGFQRVAGVGLADIAYRCELLDVELAQTPSPPKKDCGYDTWALPSCVY